MACMLSHQLCQKAEDIWEPIIIMASKDILRAQRIWPIEALSLAIQARHQQTGSGWRWVCKRNNGIGGQAKERLTLLMLGYAQIFGAKVYVCLIFQTCVLGWSNRVFAKKSYFPRTYRNLHLKHIKDNQLHIQEHNIGQLKRGGKIH